MAKGRILKTKLVDSGRWRLLYNDTFAQSIYSLIVAAVDPWGMLPADGLRLKAAIGPHDPIHTPDDYRAAAEKLFSVGLLHLWEHQGVPWLYVVGHDQEQPQAVSSRKSKTEVPRPSLEDIAQASRERYISATQASDLRDTIRDPRVCISSSISIRDREVPDASVTQPQNIPSPSLEILEDETGGPTVNPDPQLLASPDAPETRDPLPMGPGRGEGTSCGAATRGTGEGIAQPTTGSPAPISTKAVHEEQSPRTSPSVSPPLAGQPSLPSPGVESVSGLPDSSRGRSGKRIHVKDSTSSGLNVPVTSMSPTSVGDNRRWEAGSHGAHTPQRGKEQCESVCVTEGGEQPQAGEKPASSTHNTPGRRDTATTPAQVRAETRHGSRGDPSRLGDVIESQMGKAHIPTKADSWELVAVQELQQVYADAWGQDISSTLPVGDNLLRVLEVLRHPSGGVDVCRAAIKGHHKIASKDNAPQGRGFRHAFPPLRFGGRQHTERVDFDRVTEYAQIGKPPRRQEEKPKEPEISREESEKAYKKWSGVAKENIARAEGGE